MTKPSFVVAILLALTLPASAEDLRSASYMLPGCKAYVDRDVSRRPLLTFRSVALSIFGRPSFTPWAMALLSPALMR
jgi:hypothetical protein